MEYNILLNLGSLTKIANSYNFPWSVYVGVAGLPGEAATFTGVSAYLTVMQGRTAFSGWREHSRAQKVRFTFASLDAANRMPGRNGLCDIGSQ